MVAVLHAFLSLMVSLLLLGLEKREAAQAGGWGAGVEEANLDL